MGFATYAVTCVASLLVLVISGLGYFVYNEVRSIGSSHAIDGPKSRDGAENILLIGLDSRKDQNGNDLPTAILNQLHAGSKEGVDNGVGGYNTNTLILMHVPNDGSKATAFSIPRDDYVQYASALGTQQEGKIKEAYGVTKYFKETQLSNQGVHDHNKLEHLGREAARKATIATVRKLTGVPIDHFAEINLAGFYDLATALGGVEVCLKHPVNDSFSGAHFPAGYQHLNGSQALAFVRQRHGLDNGDLDRTHRQQAFLSSVAHQLKSKGVFGDIGQMQSLLNVAKKDVVVDSGWDLLNFAQEATNLTGGNVDFFTLPIERFGMINSQDVNIVDPAKIKAIVQTMFESKNHSPKPTASSAPAAPKATVDVLNAGGETGLAAQVASRLGSYGYPKGKVGNAAADHSISTVHYGAGSAADAARIAKLFGVTATADPAVQAGHVKVELGRRATVPPAPQQPAPAPAPSKPVVTMPTDGVQGGDVKGGGVRCVN